MFLLGQPSFLNWKAAFISHKKDHKKAQTKATKSTKKRLQKCFYVPYVFLMCLFVAGFCHTIYPLTRLILRS